MSFADLTLPAGTVARRAIIAGLCGFVFGVGLLLSGMTDPARVQAFLDVAGAWNPALAFVMAGAILVAVPAFAPARRHPVSAFEDPIHLPDRFHVDLRLVGGAIIFGVGWGLSCICPGPTIVLLAYWRPEALLFGAGLVAGMVVANQWVGTSRAKHTEARSIPPEGPV
jgi:uncharacterized membrane protein YedE/YeeE